MNFNLPREITSRRDLYFNVFDSRKELERI
jgi:hypothetical protein